MSEAPVSAIVPCFRCAGSVRRAAASVAAQTRRPTELVLVDDASGDGTREVLHRLREEFGAWVRVLELPANRGAAAARNAGWQAARGDYVAFLDADDEWLPRKIERQVAFMDAHREFAVTGHLARYGARADAPEGAGDGAAIHCEISRARILLGNPMVTPSFMVRRELTLRFHEASRHMEDHRFLQEAVFSGQRVARLEEALAVIHKPAYGSGGLSGELWAMERGELDNYGALRAAGRIGAPLHGLLVAYSLAKFGRRLAVVRLLRPLLP